MIQDGKEQLINNRESTVTEHERMYSLLMQAPAFICVLRSPTHIYEMANNEYYKLIGRTNIIGKTVAEIVPEAIEQGFIGLLNDVYQTGKPFIGKETVFFVARDNGELEKTYVNFIYQPITDVNGVTTGIFVHGVDVTEHVQARERVEESEARFRMLADNIENLAWMAQPDGYIYWYNKRWYDYTGATPQEMEGWGWQSVHKPETLPVVLAQWQASIQTGKPFDMTFPLKGADGIYRPFLTRVMPVKDDEGNVIHWFGTNTDISEQVQTREALQQVTAQQEVTLALLESLLKNAPVGFAFFDKEHRYIRINETLAELNGIAAQDHIGKTIEELLPENAKVVVPVINSVMTTKEPVLNLEVTGETPREPGITRYWLTGFYPVFIGKSRDVNYVGAVVIEITTMKRLEQQKDEFLAVASHELKTPVTSIKAYAQVLQKLFKRKGDTQSAEMLAKMDAQINKLITLIADLLDVSKMQAGKLQLRLNNFDFNTLVTEVVDEIQRTTTQHTIQTELAESKLVYGDRDRIGQVITNFLTNAVKYSPHAYSVIVKTYADEEAITLTVQDFGTGIPPAKQARVFEQFYRVEGHKENVYPGLGLGLYISSEIIHRHEGTIGVESEEGKGSTFSFTLPIQTRTLQQPEDTLDEEAIRHE